MKIFMLFSCNAGAHVEVQEIDITQSKPGYAEYCHIDEATDHRPLRVVTMGTDKSYTVHTPGSVGEWAAMQGVHYVYKNYIE